MQLTPGARTRAQGWDVFLCEKVPHEHQSAPCRRGPWVSFSTLSQHLISCLKTGSCPAFNGDMHLTEGCMVSLKTWVYLKLYKLVK